MNDLGHTRRSSFVPMTAGFERHIECRATRAAACSPEGQNFRMRKAGAKMESLADDTALVDDHSANHRIRTGCPPSLRRKAKGQGHVVEILCATTHRFARPAEERRPMRAGFADFTRDAAAGPEDFLVSASANAACAAASRAIATR